MAALAVLGVFFVKTSKPKTRTRPFSVALSGALFALSFGLPSLIDTLAALVRLPQSSARRVRRPPAHVRPSADRPSPRAASALAHAAAGHRCHDVHVLDERASAAVFEGALATTAFFAGVVMLVPVLVNTFVTRSPTHHGNYLAVAAGFVVVAVSAWA
ncbi:MAG: hypothetical protein ACLT98_13485 [Eggerthellaceae bacterium]